MITVRYFAAAAEAAGTESEQHEASTLGELLGAMTSAHPEALPAVLERCSLLVDGSRTGEPGSPLPPGAQVDVLPPFAGG